MKKIRSILGSFIHSSVAIGEKLGQDAHKQVIQNSFEVAFIHVQKNSRTEPVVDSGPALTRKMYVITETVC